MSNKSTTTKKKHTRKRKPRWGKGSVEWVGRRDKGRYCARISPAPGEPRERFKLTRRDGTPLDDRERDRTLAEKLTADISRRIRAGAAEKHRQERSKRMTVQELGEAWTSGELYKEHGEVNRLRPLKSAHKQANRLKAHVYPVIGSHPVEVVTEADIKMVMRKAAERSAKRRGKPWRGMTAINLYNALHRMFELAIEPCRLRDDNPVSKRFKPGKGDPKLFGYLFPEEVLSLLACSGVPIARRVLYAVAVYTGLRRSSLYALDWRGVDFHHRTLTSLKSKTGLPQMFEIGHGLVELLERWHIVRGRPRRGPIVPVAELGRVEVVWSRNEDGTGDTSKMRVYGRESDGLRADLRAAGVDRAMLFERDSDKIEPIRFHDLRSTFCTWALRAGRGDGWISDRTGHMSQSMIRRYQRQARVLADLRYEPFPDVSEAVPELRDVSDNVRRLAGR